MLHAGGRADRNDAVDFDVTAATGEDGVHVAAAEVRHAVARQQRFLGVDRSSVAVAVGAGYAHRPADAERIGVAHVGAEGGSEAVVVEVIGVGRRVELLAVELQVPVDVGLAFRARRRGHGEHFAVDHGAVVVVGLERQLARERHLAWGLDRRKGDLRQQPLPGTGGMHAIGEQIGLVSGRIDVRRRSAEQRAHGAGCTGSVGEPIGARSGQHLVDQGIRIERNDAIAQGGDAAVQGGVEDKHQAGNRGGVAG